MRWFPGRETFLQFIKFGAVGISNTIIALAIYYLFLFINHELYLIGNLVGWVVSVANAFYWNYRFVFHDHVANKKVLLTKIRKTYLSYGGIFMLSTVLLFLEIELFGWPTEIGPVVNLIITIPLNFFLNKFWTFRKKK